MSNFDHFRHYLSGVRHKYSMRVGWRHTKLSQLCSRRLHPNRHNRDMSEEDRVQRAIAEHVLWCRDRRDALTEELAQYRDGILSIGERKIGEPMTQGTITHMKYIQRTIDQLGQVIAAYTGPKD